MFEPYVNLLHNENFILTMRILYYSAYVWIPGFTLFLLWELWVEYVRGLYFAKQEYILLEIKLPKEIFKSPRAAEFFISSLSQSLGEKNWFEKYWKGSVRAWFSLEIVSIDGQVHFFVWTRKGFKNVIESNLYSQYPGIEIFEVPDYTLPFAYNPDITTIWASEFELTKPDVFPIKTYIDYGMDKDPKEEFKIDPLTPLLEFLGSLPRGNQAWIQIIVRSHKAEEKDPDKNWSNAKILTTLKPSDIWDRWEKKDVRWKNAAQEEIEKIIKKAKGEVGGDGKLVPGTGRPLTEVEKETIVALDRSVSKTGFDVGIRAIYSAPKDIFSSSNIGGVVGGITHFNSSMNGFRLARGSEEYVKFFLLAWKKRSTKRRDKERQHLLDAYKRRAYFYRPHKSPHFVLNAEELATMFHFPGGVSSTPTFTRIESRKSEAPANLPI